jgi:hypothetical protein
LGERRGSTLGPNLRSAWSGSTIGQANASEERTRHVPAGSYAVGLTMAFQPVTIQPLLDDAAGGTPQRFVYCSAVDPAIPDNAPGWPGELPLDWQRIQPPGLAGLTLHPDIKATMRRDDLARMRGDLVVAEMDSHRPLLVLKVAALLALLESRWDIGLDDWALAEVVVETSDAVRDALIAYARVQAAQVEENKTAKAVDLAVRTAAEVGQVPASTERVACNIARRVHNSETAACSRGAVRKAQDSRDRKFVDAAIDYAESQGWIRVEGTMLAAAMSRPA